MTTIERRTETVTLYPGNYQARLTDLMDRAMEALREEESGGPRRTGQKSKSMELAREHDVLLEEAKSQAVDVTIAEVSNRQWEDLADEHQPREDDVRDAKAGLNLKTFPRALLAASIADDIDLDGLSRAHYIKLERAAWVLHNGDDALPFVSLVSLLRQHRDSDSKQPPDSE